MGRYVVYDCDVGNDDAWGLMMLIKAEAVYKNRSELADSPAKFEIIGITCVQGNTSVDQTLINTLRVLKAANRNDLPIYKGCSNPIMKNEWKNPENFHGEDGFGNVEHEKPVDLNLVRAKHAVIAMYDFVCKHPKRVDFILVGPLTNFATCINMYGSAFLDKIGKIYIMGGNYRGKGNITKSAEFNFMMDPEAAHIVLASVPTPVTLLPWETCIDGDFDITLDWRLNVLGTIKSDFIELMNLVECAIFIPKGLERWLVCDAVLVAVYLFPHLTVKQSQLYHATVELAGTHTRGQMVIDHLRQEKENAKIIMEVNGEGYKKIIAWTAGLKGVYMECELEKDL
ncbi:pyrimidine-specific ribonucleoside hydrolase RihB-like isoform X1 [Rhagoletis pomonella]|uniref:pyrimidine-specific ribonucleoside hydrolase RihB-like isoform X1 n=1 Tax=Rhagoletis pomonella TaxID=28610 RepID=UPI00177CE272|nr:pyrimidine-specific ribonucleoside hydrolase RihB-like isoform X1 [Rhagoletis pomonella]XP_036317904.1 pyrimidine-specific ribonucleoside hydrolase RihB-like isoform X1 [Rhagoletis pomonella]